jgi:hypothetical protein
VFKNVFRSATDEEMPLLSERLAILREAAEVLCKVLLIFDRVDWQDAPADATRNLI